MSVDEVIGANVHDLMWRRHIRHRQMYEAMGLSRGSLAKKMRGQVAWSAADIAAAADLLHVPPGQLFAARKEWAPSDSNREPTDSRVRHLMAVAA